MNVTQVNGVIADSAAIKPAPFNSVIITRTTIDFGSIDALAAATQEQLLEVGDVGEVIARSIYDFLHDPVQLEQIARLRAAGLRFDGAGQDTALSDALAGKTIVISGNFSISRERMKDLIAAHGGKAGSSVSGATAFLLAGAKPGPEKLKKCEKLGIPVISEEEFRAMLPAQTPSGSGSSSAIGLSSARPTLPGRTATEEPCQSGESGSRLPSEGISAAERGRFSLPDGGKPADADRPGKGQVIEELTLF